MIIRAQERSPLIMGILNVTPDSFSGDGILKSQDYVSAAVRKAEEMLKDGADIIDIGGESTRPGHEVVGIEEEICRTVPVIAAIKKSIGDDAVISIDTTKPEVAKAAIEAGAEILNDVSGLRANKDMYKLAADNDVYLVLMHNGASIDAVKSSAGIGNEYISPSYDDVVMDVISGLNLMIGNAKASGVSLNKMLIDPGIGFGKTVEQNLKLLNNLDRLKDLGCPIMVGPSRKYFIGQTLDLPVEDRLEGTAAAVAVSVMKGADIIRIHDVKAMTRVSKMAYAIKNSY